MKNRVAYFGVFTALALIFSYIETLVPISFGIPGVKLGLANLIIVIALYKIPLREVYVLSIVRVLLSGVLFGNYFSIAYSLAGGSSCIYRTWCAILESVLQAVSVTILDNWLLQ